MGCEHAYDTYHAAFLRLRDDPTTKAMTRTVVNAWVDFMERNRDGFVESCRSTARQNAIPECAASPITFRRFVVVARSDLRKRVGFALANAFEVAVQKESDRVSPALIKTCEDLQGLPDPVELAEQTLARAQARQQSEVTDRAIREELDRERLLRSLERQG